MMAASRKVRSPIQLFFHTMCRKVVPDSGERISSNVSYVNGAIQSTSRISRNSAVKEFLFQQNHLAHRSPSLINSWSNSFFSTNMIVERAFIPTVKHQMMDFRMCSNATVFNTKGSSLEKRKGKILPPNMKRKKISGRMKRKLYYNDMEAPKLVDEVLLISKNKSQLYVELDKWLSSFNRFPLFTIKRSLEILTTRCEWEQIIQVLEWMLSKGQGKTMRTYDVLLKAFDAAGRPKDAKSLWENQITKNMESVPSKMFLCMISIYEKHEMYTDIIKLFTHYEASGRKSDKNLATKAAHAFGKMGFLEKEKQILRKYDIPLNTNG